MDLSVSIQALDFSVVLPSIFGNDVNHLLNVFDPMESGLTLTDENGVFYLGEQYDVGGKTLEMVGSGTAIPGISVLGVILPTGFPVDVMIMQETTTGQNYFVYPDGTPNILSAVALVTNTSAEPYSADFAGAPPVCFCDGTRIATPDGPRNAERLLPGDKVLAADGAVRRVVWCGGKTHAALPPDQRPIVFRPGALGDGLPKRRLRVSPNHRLVLGALRQWPRFAPAKAFTILPGVHQQRRQKPVAYHHILLDRHAPMLAEGVAAESLLVGPQARKMLGAAAIENIAQALGCAADAIENRPEAQPCGRLLGAQSARRKIAEIAQARGGANGVGSGATSLSRAAPPPIMAVR